jgi:trimeric autotransporter adhesin
MTHLGWASALGLLLMSASSGSAQQYLISTYAGGAPPPTPAVGTTVSIGGPHGVAIDAAGNVYFASDYCVFKLDTKGVLTRVAGNSRGGFSGDGGPAASAQLHGSNGVVVDSAGNLYIADGANDRIRKVTPAGIISTVAGSGNRGYSGDGGPATSAQLKEPNGVAIDSTGNLYIADYGNNRIRQVTPAGIISTVAGTGTSGSYSGDGGPATSAQLNAPIGVALDSVGNLFIADSFNNRIRKVTPAGNISTVAGNGSPGYSGDGGPGVDAQINDPLALTVDSTGNLYIADSHRIRKVTPAGTISTVAGTGASGVPSGDGGPATSANISAFGIAVDSTGNLYIADLASYQIRRVTPSGIINAVAGNGSATYSGDGGLAASAQLSASGVAVDNAGNLYIADSANSRVRKVTPLGIISTVAGNGIAVSLGDGGPAASAQLSATGVAVDSVGNLYIADTGNSRIRKVTPGGIITTAAGNGSVGSSGDGGQATSAQLSSPNAVAVDSAGNVYIDDTGNNRIRKVTPAGVISTVAGNGSQGYSGDGGPATSAQINGTNAVAVDTIGNLYIADSNRVRKVTPAGTISTVAGNGSPGYSGDGGPAVSAQFNGTLALGVDSAGNLYIADYGNNRIRKVTPAGNVSTVAGNGTQGYSGDGGPAVSAQLSAVGVAVDSVGRVYVADSSNNAVRLLQPQGASPAPPSLTPGGIAPAFSPVNTIQPGEWVSIYGTNLASTITTWDGTFPNTLGGASVTINGKAAYLSYVSPLQINVQAPDDAAAGPVTVVVTTANGTAAGTVTLAPFAPSLLLLDEKHVAGIIPRSDGSGAYGGGGYDIIGPTGTSLGYRTIAAKPGDRIQLYAVGLGPTNPTVASGKPFAGAAPTTTSVIVLINGVSVTPSFAGLSGAGLYQINLTIPAGLGTGDVPLATLVSGVQTQPGVVISVQ